MQGETYKWEVSRKGWRGCDPIEEDKAPGLSCGVVRDSVLDHGNGQDEVGVSNGATKITIFGCICL